MKMKKNSGDDIQALASIMMAIGVVISGIIAFGLYKLDDDFTGVSIVVFLIGCFLSWASTVIIRGFGELVQYTAEAATYLEALSGQTPISEDMDDYGEKTEVRKAETEKTEDNESEGQKDSDIKTNPLKDGNFDDTKRIDIKPEPAAENSRVCKRCGKIQEKSNQFCWYCGEKL
ncbi:MAG: hypothetical protein LIO81_01195 [Clostridiales bacterium]|nr:hypothetical protein [Clostridiales bacterium]